MITSVEIGCSEQGLIPALSQNFADWHGEFTAVLYFVR